MNIGELYPKKWLAALDLPPNKSVTVHIEAAEVVQVFNRRAARNEPKLAIAFYGKQKRLLCNKTQAYAIAGIVGSQDTDAWPGHTVALSVGTAPNGAATIVVTAPPATNGKQPAVDPAPAADGNPFEDGAAE